MNKITYLDNNATTPLHPEVKKSFIDALDIFGNASSLHQMGRIARAHIEDARAKVADFLDASPEEIIFTSGASESNNAILNNVVCDNSSCGTKVCSSTCCSHVITSVIEHPSVYETCKELAKDGVKVTFVGVDNKGVIKMDQIKEALKTRAALVSIMLANNEIGSIQPIKEVVAIAKATGTLVHTDAVQAIGKMKVSVKDLGVDYLSLSGHKLYGPKGIGVLYVKKGIKFCPLIKGGHHEFNLRAGTENIPAIVALGKAVEVLKTGQEAEVAQIKKLRDSLKDGIVRSIPDIIINGDVENGLVNTLNISFKYVEGEAIMLYLDLEGIEVSTGSACASGSLEPSQVLLSTGIPIEFAHGSIRFSFGRENTQADVDKVLEVLPPIIAQLRKMSPLYKKQK